MTLEERLFDRPTAFQYFQAVQILEMLKDVNGRARGKIDELIRFKTFPTLNFPSSSVRSVRNRLFHSDKPHIFVNFMGLVGTQGALPLHYTLKVLSVNKLVKEDDLFTSPLLEWLDLFNHRFLSLFYQAWEKYRFSVIFGQQARIAERTKTSAYRQETDDFTQALLCLVGLGVDSTRRRFRIHAFSAADDTQSEQEPLATIPDLALLHYSGNLSRQPRHALGLESMLSDYFGLAVEVDELTGQWLQLDESSQTRFTETSNCLLGENVVAGDRIWDFNSMFRLCVGPLNYDQFVELLPDPSPSSHRKSFFLMSQMTRLYVGSEFDFEVQLLLLGNQVPECEFVEPGDGVLGARLGWNTWLRSDNMPEVVKDAVFVGDDRTSVPR
jgi:type VI secretion system protein ImpH